MNEIKKLIIAELQKLHEKDTLRGIAANYERLADDLLSKKKYELRRDKLTDKNGKLVDLSGDCELIVDSASYIGRRSNAAEQAKYISKFEKPSKEAREKMAKEMEGVLQKISRLRAVVPADEENYNRALSLIAKNFLYQVDNGEVVFRKINDSGLLGEHAYSFDDLMPHHLIDNERTQLAREFKNAELKATARKLIDSTTIRKETLDEKIQLLKKHEILAAIPAKKLPQISRSEIERETVRKEALIRGLDPDEVIRSGGQRLADLNRIAKREYDALDDTFEIKRQLDAIQPKGPATYESISYQ